MTSGNERVKSLEVVTDLLSDVVSKEGVIDPVYEISSGSEKGDGYTSFMTRVIVRGKNKVLPLIIKSALNTPKSRETGLYRLAFLQEIIYYEKIFPAFKEFQKKLGVKNPFVSFPICYKTIDSDRNELLILENIKEKGFKVFDKIKQMDQAHVEMVLRTYGQFHAISFAMKEHDMDRFEKLSKYLCNLFSHENPEFYDMLNDGVDKMKLTFDENTESDARQSISTLKDKAIHFFKIIQTNNQSGVLLHGDCWCNNMMFKYEDGKSTPPTDLRLFDFQIGTLGSPVIDLSYFIYISASQDMLDNLDYYLKVYHDSLRKHMLEMGSDVDKYFPYSMLKEEWIKYAKYGLYLSLIVFRVMLRDGSETLDMTDEVGTLSDVFMNKSKNDDLINERYRRVGSHFYKNKFI